MGHQVGSRWKENKAEAANALLLLPQSLQLYYDNSPTLPAKKPVPAFITLLLSGLLHRGIIMFCAVGSGGPDKFFGNLLSGRFATR